MANWFTAPYQVACQRIEENKSLLAGIIPPRLSKAGAKFVEVVKKGLLKEIERVNNVRAAAIDRKILFYEYKNEEIGAWAFVHPSTFYKGCFRFTEFNEDGWMGHQDAFVTVEDAFYEMHNGYVKPDKGRLEKLMKTHRWKVGVKKLELMQLRNKYYMAGDYEMGQKIDKMLDDLK